MGKAALNKKNKENALMQTSFDLFTNKGFAKTTISDIVKQAGLAKGTFYLYFKDKYDLHDKLVIHKVNQLFGEAHLAMAEHDTSTFEEQIIIFADYIINRFEKDPVLLKFISRNLSWGIFKHAFEKNLPTESQQFFDYYMQKMEESGVRCTQPDLMLFTLIELIGSTCYSCILYQQPVTMQEYLPYLHKAIHQIVAMYTEHE